MIRKAVILPDGLGTRLMEETGSWPKPMVEIGGMPIVRINSEPATPQFPAWNEAAA